MGRPGGFIAKKSLARYDNAGLDFSADELIDNWFSRKLNSSVFKQVASDIHLSYPISEAGLVRARLKKYWLAESARKTQGLFKSL